MKYLLSPVLLISLIIFSNCDPEPDYAYTDWDTNADERIDEEEFYTAYDEIGYYNEWDLNDDDLIDDEEWGTGIGGYYPDYNYEEEGMFEDWDLNNDDFVDQDEFVSGAYTLWDVDGDGKIEKVEYDEYYYNL